MTSRLAPLAVLPEVEETKTITLRTFFLGGGGRSPCLPSSRGPRREKLATIVPARRQPPSSRRSGKVKRQQEERSTGQLKLLGVGCRLRGGSTALANVSDWLLDAHVRKLEKSISPRVATETG